MIDIDAEFRKAMGATTSTCNTPTSDEPLTIEKLIGVARKLGPPPPRIHLSKHVPVMIDAKPTAAPRTDDMRVMCEDIGPQKVAGAFRIKSQFGDMVVMNPFHLKRRSGVF